MLKALVSLARLFVTVPFFELAGTALVTAAAWGAWGIWAGLGVLGGCCFLKSLDLALEREK